MQSVCPQSLGRVVADAFCAVTVLLAVAGTASAWQTSHGNPDNSNSADVRTAAAVKPIANLHLDGIAVGMVPVIAPNGTFYIADLHGKLMSFSPDGAPGWSRNLGGFESALAAPALGSDGSVYVIGSAKVRDNTTNPPTVREVAELHRFTAGGGWLWHVPLAEPAEGLTYSSPNIVRVGGADVVLVGTGRKQNGLEAFLTAFSADGVVIAHQKASVLRPPEVTGGGDFWPDFLTCIFTGECFSTTFDPIPIEQRLPKDTMRPFPAVAVYTETDSGLPRVFISDRFQDLVGYSFTGSAFSELFRAHDNQRYVTSTPLVWPNGPVMISTNGPDVGSEMMFISLAPSYAGGPVTMHRIKVPESIAAPAALGNFRFAVVNFNGGVTFLNGAAIEKQIKLNGQSIASAAASRNHVFVSTVTALYTFNKVTMEKVGEFAWSRGGKSQPVIGPQGHVYAIAQDQVYIFPPSRLPDIPDIGSLPDITPTKPVE